MSSRSTPPASLDDVEAILRDPTTYALGECIPEKGRAGRPRTYPEYMWLVYDALISVWKSARQVEAELSHPVVWEFVRDTVRSVFPDDPEMWLPDEPIRRHHYEYGRRYLDDPEVQGEFLRVNREEAAQLARDIGLLDPDGPGSFSHPHESRVIQADGKVVTPLFTGKPDETRVDKATGEILPLRHDPDASLHVTGDGNHVWGNKFVITSTRSEHDRVILDVAAVPKGTVGGEAAVAVESFRRIAPCAPGVHGVVYDMALRGTHVDSIMRDLGWLALAKVTAKASGTTKRGKRVGKYVPKDRHIEVKTVVGPDGKGQAVPIYAVGGAAGVGRLTDTGELAFVALERIRTHRNANKGGGYRWYNDYGLPADLGGGTITLRLLGNDADKKAGLNRTENLRAIPPTDADFKRLFPRRNDTESINRALDDTLYLRRAHSVGQIAQLTDLLGFALLVNARTRARHRAREPLPVAA
jgi:hypothetical protein